MDTTSITTLLESCITPVCLCQRASVVSGRGPAQTRPARVHLKLDCHAKGCVIAHAWLDGWTVKGSADRGGAVLQTPTRIRIDCISQPGRQFCVSVVPNHNLIFLFLYLFPFYTSLAQRRTLGVVSSV